MCLSCSTAKLELELGLGIWGKHEERDLLSNILREFLEEKLSDELQQKIFAPSLWDAPGQSIISYMISRMGWTPSGFLPTELVEQNLRGLVKGLESEGMLTVYAQDWLREQARGW